MANYSMCVKRKYNQVAANLRRCCERCPGAAAELEPLVRAMELLGKAVNKHIAWGDEINLLRRVDKLISQSESAAAVAADANKRKRKP